MTDWGFVPGSSRSKSNSRTTTPVVLKALFSRREPCKSLQGGWNGSNAIPTIVLLLGLMGGLLTFCSTSLRVLWGGPQNPPPGSSSLRNVYSFRVLVNPFLSLTGSGFRSCFLHLQRLGEHCGVLCGASHTAWRLVLCKVSELLPGSAPAAA